MRARLVAVAVIAVVMTTCTPDHASASPWTVQPSASSAEAAATGLPAAPSGVAAACVSALQTKIKVTWSAVPLASGYTVYESTTSGTSGFSPVVAGVVGTAWTSGSLTSGNYWFEAAASIGANWLGSTSTATGETSITVLLCTQP